MSGEAPHRCDNAARRSGLLARGARTNHFFLLVLALTIIGYISALALIDNERNVFTRLSDASRAMPALVMLSFVSYALRFLRWHMALWMFGHRVPFGYSFLAYIAGFALTASPGKAGELLRVRYLAAKNVAAAHVVGTFVFERLLDLVVLLAFASLIARETEAFPIAVAFVVVVGACAMAIAALSRLRLRLQAVLRNSGLRMPARVLRTLLRGVGLIGRLCRPLFVVPMVVLGVIAWAVQCLGFSLALGRLGVDLVPHAQLAIAPAAILIGAASIMPGGVGTTETAMVLMLTAFGTPLELAVLAAITLRLGSIWFAILIGLISVVALETSHTFKQQR